MRVVLRVITVNSKLARAVGSKAGHKCNAHGETTTLAVASAHRGQQLYMACGIHPPVLGRSRLPQTALRVSPTMIWAAAGAAVCFTTSGKHQTTWQSCVCSSPCTASNSPAQTACLPWQGQEG